MHFGAKLHASAGVVGGVQNSANVSDTFNWADPMIGLRWEVPVLESARTSSGDWWPTCATGFRGSRSRSNPGSAPATVRSFGGMGVVF